MRCECRERVFPISGYNLSYCGFSLAQCVKLTIALGVLLGYAVQFFVPIQILYPSVRRSARCTDKNPIFGELVFRTLMVLVTFTVAEIVPNLSLFLSLLGAVCSTTIAFVLPPIMEFVILSCEDEGISWFVFSKNSIILIISFLGILTGGYESLSGIIEAFFH
jgi:solute carrier family 36 (proton-coupled amino acid transporter)